MVDQELATTGRKCFALVVEKAGPFGVRKLLLQLPVVLNDFGKALAG